MALPNEAEELFDFLVRHFFPLPPLRQIHRIDDSEEAKRPLWKLEQIRRSLLQPYTLIARDAQERNRLVGLVLNEIKDRPFTPAKVDPKDRSVGWIPRALNAELNRELDFFTLYDTDRVVHGHTGSVIPQYVNTGIGYELFQHALSAAAAAGAGAVKGEAYTVLGRKSLLRNGFYVIRTINYDDFKLDGEYPLAGISQTGETCAILGARRLLPPSEQHVDFAARSH